MSNKIYFLFAKLKFRFNQLEIRLFSRKFIRFLMSFLLRKFIYSFLNFERNKKNYN